LFEMIPDLIPEGFLTEVEISLWADYYEERRERLNSLKDKR